MRFYSKPDGGNALIDGPFQEEVEQDLLASGWVPVTGWRVWAKQATRERYSVIDYLAMVAAGLLFYIAVSAWGVLGLVAFLALGVAVGFIEALVKDLIG